MVRELTDHELDQAWRWLDGEMTMEESLRYERVLAENAELSAAVEPLVEMDLLRSRLPPRKSTRSLPTFRWLAAAAILVGVSLMLSRWMPTRSTIRFRVAAVPAVAMARDHHALLGLDPALSAPGITWRTRGVEPLPVDARTYVDRASSRESKLIDDALREGVIAIEATRFRVPIRLEQRAFIAVFGVGEDGSVERLYPRGDDSVRAPLEAGLHVLPAPALRVTSGVDGAEVLYDPGFNLPTRFAAYEVVVAVGQNPIEAAPWDSVVGRNDLVRALERAGLTTSTLRVVESEE